MPLKHRWPSVILILSHHNTRHSLSFSHWFLCPGTISGAYSWHSLFSRLTYLRELRTQHKTCRSGSECFKYLELTSSSEENIPAWCMSVVHREKSYVLRFTQVHFCSQCFSGCVEGIERGANFTPSVTRYKIWKNAWVCEPRPGFISIPEPICLWPDSLFSYLKKLSVVHREASKDDKNMI